MMLKAVSVHCVYLLYVLRVGELPWSFQFGLDDDSEGGIAVNILPLVVPSHQLVSQKVTPLTSHTQCALLWLLD